MASILLIEPHPLLHLGLRHLLAQSRLHDAIIDVDPDESAPQGAGVSHADLLLLGLSADPGAAAKMLNEVGARYRPQRILLLVDAAGGPPLALGELPDAVRGVLTKDSSAGVLEAAIHLVLAGGECFPAHALTAAAGRLGTEAGRAEPPRRMPLDVDAATWGAEPGETPLSGSHLLNITERQYEVLALLARGYPIKTVSRVLNISVATAKTHACTLYHRLQVRNKGEAVYVALQRGATLNWAGPGPGQRPIREAA